MAIETNHVESTFLLTQSSTQDLVRRGVSEGVIDYLPQSSLQDPVKIKKFLSETHAACFSNPDL
ncbi:hypothetical protein K443DRAFT_680242 [Laccaria amethystina LaAM-08-1]|uniref:Uncharacterized protein n=1 Tax=Laccaria amethystina LaAM-08-1 TaxID=1095629 RepID=A0A0C9XNH6_9AGAR|nr:hypothetical protein K443DRAFT_680242 [Laccaria amethystina LaAM-08-1]